MELDLKSSRSLVARKHLIKRTEEAIESFLRDDCATNLKLIGALEEISFRLFAESNDVFLSETCNAPDDNEFQWEDEFIVTRTDDDSGLPDENEWLTESIHKSKTSICPAENIDANYFVEGSPLMCLTISPGDLIMTSSTAKFNRYGNAELKCMVESDEIWMLDTCDEEHDENLFCFVTPSTAKSTRDSKFHACSWMITGLKSDKCRMPLTFGPEHLKKRPFLAIPSSSKHNFRILISTCRGKYQEDLRAVPIRKASKDGCAEKSEENPKGKKRKSVVKRLFTNECGVEHQSGLNRLEQFMLQEDINIAPTIHVDKYARSYQSEEEEILRSPFHRDEKRNRTLSTRHRSAKEDDNMMEIMNGDKSITRIRFYVMDNQQIKLHKETNESPGDEQDWLVISTEDTTGGSLCSKTIELFDDYWILISHNEDNSGTQKDSLYYHQKVNKNSLCHQEEPTFCRNVGVKTSLNNSTGIQLTEPLTHSHANSNKMQTKVVLQSTEMVARPRSRPPILSFYYESEFDDWIIITMQDGKSSFT
ncbi:hypothetical protein ACJMK2_035441 [Sinanodonta woodiana]|uniref:Uncharacterized protein n=1 Tax=Sinanodonta woodiana TaxID=1069815 RepID=A0ABD3WUZ4_SINWO